MCPGVTPGEEKHKEDLNLNLVEKGKQYKCSSYIQCVGACTKYVGRPVALRSASLVKMFLILESRLYG